MTFVLRRMESTFALPSRGSHALSEEAASLEEKVVSALKQIRHERHRAVWYDLMHLCEEEREDGEAPFLADSLAMARRFLSVLPSAFPEPEVDLDPDGEVRFDWLLSRQRMFSVSFGPDGFANYAGLMDGSSFYGREEIGSEFPPRFAAHFRQLFEEAHV